ncbi:hypothetical protein R9C00_08375 [Flammeovirgaceae bacterium SG7u.111]|nr:hypothetical protein [Flammeovirgaceae bacterium SG7u.132]WPO37462.1 hypothetical protein R9C00_08375 [Flammeovirgaceae bacterium SG7u.111]
MKIKKITPKEHAEIKEWFNKIDEIVATKSKPKGKGGNKAPWSRN